MAIVEDDTTVFSALWPTTFLVQPLPEANGQQDRLRSLAQRHDGQGVFAVRDAAILWLQSQVAHGVNQLLHHYQLASDIRWRIGARFQRLVRGDYDTLHNHPGSYLSGMYFIDCPVQPEETNRDDLSPGCLSFFDPRTGMNMNAIRDDPYVKAEQVLSPEPGLLLVWPSFVRYFVHPNLSAEPAHRVIFNVFLHNLS